MDIPTYILGFLIRYGPQHGYKLKQLISEVASDFTKIKLPTIYYHLEKLKQQGLITSSRDQEGRRPERFVYTATEKGVKEFGAMVKEALDFSYQPQFKSDLVLFFSEAIDKNELTKIMNEQLEALKKNLAALQESKKVVSEELKDEGKFMTGAILKHHEYHYIAEIEWLTDIIQALTD
ncbi:MAG: PadR family transcriptional regulator [Caulobacteraceae bacterium]